MDPKIKKLRHALRVAQFVWGRALLTRDPAKLAAAADLFKYFEDAFREMARHAIVQAVRQ